MYIIYYSTEKCALDIIKSKVVFHFHIVIKNVKCLQKKSINRNTPFTLYEVGTKGTMSALIYNSTAKRRIYIIGNTVIL